jgi:dipeptidyl aminopeptidase/acylaminoacyl peptidase
MGDDLIGRLATVAQVTTDYRPFSISPDGGAVAFTWYRGGDWQIHTVDGRGDGEPSLLLSLPDACLCPLFSADGAWLYFARDDKGSERYDFYRYRMADGELENLLPDSPEFSPLPDFALSPDGATIALAADHGASYKAALMPASPRPGAAHVTFVSEHGANDHSPIWSPDGTHIAFEADTTGQDSAVFVHAPGSASPRAIGGGDAFLAAQPRWTCDGRALAFAGGPFEHPAIGAYDLDRDMVTWLWRGEHDAHHPAWSPDCGSVAFLVDREAETSLKLLDVRTGALRTLDIGPGNHYAPAFTPGGEALLVVFSGPGEPADLYRVELSDGAVTQLTRSLPPELSGHTFYSGRHVRYRSLDRLTDVPGLLCVPREPNGGGVVIVHGGPTWHHSNEWDPLRQALLDKGYTVVHPNYRGSDGYGRTWQLANRFLVGQGEVQDCAGALAFLVTQGCDPARIAVTGRSWGGFMTMACLTQFPELFCCGVAGVPFFDFIDAQEDTAVREDLRWWDRENSGDLEKDRARLEYFSPINHLDRLRAPLLLLAAANDPRCPPTQVGLVADRVRANGVTCEAIVYPDEGHEISGFEHRVDYDRRTVEFIARHVGR